MRLFQNFDIYPRYLSSLRRKFGSMSYGQICKKLLDDRFIALHMLHPVLSENDDAAFAIGRDRSSQRDWARSQGMSSRSSAEVILLSQIEHHRTEVLYNLDPVRFGSDFARKLPGCVKRKIAWRAAPSPGADFGAYDLVVCNFESILESYRKRGWRAAWFYPAFDPVMAEYARSEDRPIDILFVGTYSRHHRQRASVIQAVADLSQRYNVKLCLQKSRLTQLADAFPSWMPKIAEHALPAKVKQVAAPPVFGRELYRALSSAKIVVNGAIDMSGNDRGNMRCWETLGCRALMLSDSGNYPSGMKAGMTFETYDSVDDFIEKIDLLLIDVARREKIASDGFEMIKSEYSKERQWRDFQNLTN